MLPAGQFKFRRIASACAYLRHGKLNLESENFYIPHGSDPAGNLRIANRKKYVKREE